MQHSALDHKNTAATYRPTVSALYAVPDRPFHNSRASKAVDRQIICTWEVSIGNLTKYSRILGAKHNATRRYVRRKMSIVQDKLYWTLFRNFQYCEILDRDLGSE